MGTKPPDDTFATREEWIVRPQDPGCDRAECNGTASVVPVLAVRGTPAPMALKVCLECSKGLEATDCITREGFARIGEEFTYARRDPPTLEDLELSWEPLR